MKSAPRIQSAPAFWAAFEQQQIPLPFGPMLATDLYDAYRTFCIAHDVPCLPSNRLVPWVMLQANVRRIDARIPWPLIGQSDDESTRRKPRRRHRILLPPGYRPQLNAGREKSFMLTALRKFRWALDAWQREIRKSLSRNVTAGRRGSEGYGSTSGEGRGDSQGLDLNA